MHPPGQNTIITAFRSRAVLVAALVYLVLSIVCTQIPLLNYLGFEFSVLTALVTSLMSALLTVGMLRKTPVAGLDGNTVASTKLLVFWRAVIVNLLLLIIPLAIIASNALFVRNCAIIEGFLFYLLLPVVSSMFASSLALFCEAHYSWARTMVLLFGGATFVYSLALGYFTPAIFSYNFFYGYFPGLTYDEALGIGRPLVLFRVVTLCAACVLVWLALLLYKHSGVNAPFWKKGLTLVRVVVERPQVYLTFTLLLFVTVLFVYRNELGFESHEKFIQHRLGAVYETANFTIYYAPESYPGEEIRWIAAEHEFRLHQLMEVFHLPTRRKIASYVYPSGEMKQRLMGAGNTNIAKPWSGQIHITKQSLDATLKHELVHVVAAPLGAPIIKASLSTGLVEGLAMAVEWEWGNRTLHQYAAAMRTFGLAPDVTRIMSLTGFAAQSSSLSYVQAGSFCRYLIDCYGIQKMAMLYRSADFLPVYGRSLPELMAEWNAFLDRIPLGDQDRIAVDVLFRRPAIFRKVCARVVAARNIEAGRLFARRDYDRAADLFKQSFDDGSGYDALSGYVASALHARKFDAIVAAYDSVMAHDERSAQYLPLSVTVGIAQWGGGNLDEALSLFMQVRSADVGESLTEGAAVCRLALSDSVNRQRMLEYFVAAPHDTARISLLDSMRVDPVHHPLPLYLKGRVLARLHRWNEALPVLGGITLAGVDSRLEAMRLKTLGVTLFRLARFEEAKGAFWTSLNANASEVAQNEVNEWVDRCDWLNAYRGTQDVR